MRFNQLSEAGVEMYGNVNITFLSETAATTNDSFSSYTRLPCGAEFVFVNKSREKRACGSKKKKKREKKSI